MLPNVSPVRENEGHDQLGTACSRAPEKPEVRRNTVRPPVILVNIRTNSNGFDRVTTTSLLYVGQRVQRITKSWFKPIMATTSLIDHLQRALRSTHELEKWRHAWQTP